MNIRKITESEIEVVSKKFTEIFYNYKAYNYFITEDNKFEKMYNMFLYEIYPTYKFTYTTENYKGLCVMQKPGEEDLKNCYTREFIEKINRILSTEEIEKLKKYITFAREVSSKYFDKTKDCYVRNLGVELNSRGKGIAKKMIEQISEGKSIFLETHDKKNLLIYERMGFEVVLEKRFADNVIHYCLKREKKRAIK